MERMIYPCTSSTCLFFDSRIISASTTAYSRVRLKDLQCFRDANRSDSIAMFMPRDLFYASWTVFWISLAMPPSDYPYPVSAWYSVQTSKPPMRRENFETAWNYVIFMRRQLFSSVCGRIKLMTTECIFLPRWTGSLHWSAAVTCTEYWTIELQVNPKVDL